MFNTIEEAIADIKAGKMIIVADDENRENEGDLVMAADFCRPEDVNFMITKARGLVCVPISCAQAQRLGLEPMVEHNTDAHCTAFTVSVDKLHGTTTGISAAERATTARALADPKSIGGDFRKPGHIFPLTARPGGVLQRAGHTEAAVDITRLAGLNPAGVICEIMNEDGTMARLPQLLEFAAREGLKIISVEELIRYRVMREKFVKKEVTVPMPTQWGDFVCHAYTSPYGESRCRRSGATSSATHIQAHTATTPVPSTSRSSRETYRATSRCSSAYTPNASLATCSARCAATAARSSTPLCR